MSANFANPSPTPPTTRAWKEKVYAATGVIIFLLLSGPAFLTEGKSLLNNLKKSKQLNQYKGQIETCTVRKQAETNGKQVIGLDFSCAIDVAATLYANDPETAIDLCMKYNALAPKGDPKDPYVRNLTLIHRSACRSSIEKRLSPTNSTP